MYSKLIKKNFTKTFKDYLIYFITISLSSSLFFAFMSLTSSKNSLLEEANQFNFDIFYTWIKYATYIITISLLVLINYVNKHMLKRRVKELSIYMILGMQQTKVAFLFFIETLMLGLLAVVVGNLVGTLLSGVLTTLIVLSISDTFKFSIVFYPDTAVRTLFFFLIIYTLIGFLNIRKLSRWQLIDLLVDDKKTEGNLHGKIFYIMTSIVAIVSYGTAYIFLKRFFQIGRSFNGDIPYYESNLNQIFIFLSIIVAIYATYHTMSNIVIIIKSKSKKYKYSNLNLVLIGNLLQKISSNARTMATITITLIVALSGFVLAPILADLSEGFLTQRTQFDIKINNRYTSIDKLEDIPKIDYSFVDKILEDNNIAIKESLQLEQYFIWETDFNNDETRVNKFDYPRLAVGLSDYNQLRKMQGYEPIKLGNDEFVMHLSHEVDRATILEKFKTEQLIINDKGLKLNSNKIYNESLDEYIYNLNTQSILVFPDDITNNLKIALTKYFIHTKEPVDYDLSIKLPSIIQGEFKEKYEYLYDKYDDNDFVEIINPIRFKTAETNLVMFSSITTRLLGIYIGIIFLIISLTILALQQLTDSIEGKNRFDILHKMGVSQKDLNKLINKQITIYFGLPGVISLLGSAVVLYTFVIRFGHKLKVYVDKVSFIYNVTVPSIIVVIIFISYFLITIYSYKHSIRDVFNDEQ
ncbi:FtsX-like permease family protein [Bacillus solimangrovi]|uniref:ABC3 transporter permease C-terminal domain-containing protein n=1 Tax=Bacillus solimangrovi TaxID=1305675 RepID=A0A1E5LJV7_9BACI|nr:ABC transporter permease [Bacillus solimangrovi]OEH94364.1 hypothetical protein BFG57_07815 [Bacillus solimangrovi]